MQNFQALGAPPPDPKNSPSNANFWLRAWQLFAVNIRFFVAFVLRNFFLIVQLQPYDVNYRCMPNT